MTRNGAEQRMQNGQHGQCSAARWPESTDWLCPVSEVGEGLEPAPYSMKNKNVITFLHHAALSSSTLFFKEVFTSYLTRPCSMSPSENCWHDG